jgi:outer membrane protein
MTKTLKAVTLRSISLLRAVGIASLFLTSSWAVAQQTARIGFVDPVRLIEQAPQGAQALKKLEDEFRSRDDELKDLHNRIQEMEADLEKNILVMDATTAQTRQRDIENQKRRLARSQQEAREDYNLRRNEELARLQTLVREVIVDLARDKKFDLVVEQAVYVSDAVDITEQVLERLAQLTQ